MTAVALRRAGLRVGTTDLLRDVTWALERREHAVVLGPNGAGKTTLLRLLAGRAQPTSGTVDVLGHRLGRTDVRALWPRVGVVSDALDPLVDRTGPTRRLVAAALHGMTTAHGALLRRADLDRADAALTRLRVDHLGDRRGSEVSEGEWQRVLLARALVLEPALLLLDEPCSGLDLAERERFLADLDRVLSDPDGPTVVLVTHHLEEVPPSVPTALLLRDGGVAAAGPVDTTLTSEHVSVTFGLAVDVTARDGRWTARAHDGTTARPSP